MRKFLLVTALIPAAFWIGGVRCVAQQPTPPADSNQQQAAPDAPQPEKKPAQSHAAAKPSAPAHSSGAPSSSGQPADQASSPPAKSSDQPRSSSEENPFPEDISRKAAQAAGDAQTGANSSPAQSGTKSSSANPHSSASDNPFPEDVSRKAAQAAAKDSAGSGSNPSETPASPGESSSASSGLTSGLDGSANPSGVADPARAQQDTQVGNFYLGQGDYRGAYLRYQDAMRFDPANINAIFGAAEAARRLGKLSEAARNYQMYLEIEPNGSKAKRALKALSALQNKN